MHDGRSTCAIGVKHQLYSFHRILFDFGGEQFSYLPWTPFLTEAGIAVVSSVLGVGGGFLLAPLWKLLNRCRAPICTPSPMSPS